MTDDEFVRVMVVEAAADKVACANWPEAYPYTPEVLVNLAYSDKSLALMYRVREKHILGSVLENNGPVWDDSCVETFIKDPVSEGYYNLEVNCIGTKLAAHRLSRTDFEHFSEDKMAQIRCVSLLPHEQTDMVNAAGRQWFVALLLPFALIGLDRAPETLRGNFYKCGDKCDQPHYLSWPPISLPEPNFHCPDFFGKLNLVK
jgi:hypothetical protein